MILPASIVDLSKSCSVCPEFFNAMQCVVGSSATQASLNSAIKAKLAAYFSSYAITFQWFIDADAETVCGCW